MKKLILALIIPMALTGCETLQTKPGDKTTSAAVGGAIGCAGGALLAHFTGHSAATGCIAGGVAGALIGYERARQQEIADAEQARQDAIAALNRPVMDGNGQTAFRPGQAPTSTVQTADVSVRDKTTGEVKQVKALSNVEVNIPLSMKGTPQFNEAMEKLKVLATRIADQRGSAEIVIAMNSADAKQQKVVSSTNQVRTDSGNVITVTKAINSAVPAGMERVTVKAGRLNTEV